MSRQASKSIFHLGWEYLAHLHLLVWIVGGIAGLATLYWPWAIQWGYPANALAAIAAFVLAVILLSVVSLLWRRLHFGSVKLGEQDDLYRDLEKLYANQHDGKATFYHYSGTKIHKFVIMLFENGYEVRLFVESPETAHRLKCNFQRDRILQAIAQFKRELPSCAKKGSKNGHIKIYQCDAPLSMRAALLDDRRIAFGWYIYEAATLPPEHWSADKLAVWGHNSWGFVIDNRHPQFGPARDFLTKCEKWIGTAEVWSYPP